MLCCYVLFIYCSFSLQGHELEMHVVLPISNVDRVTNTRNSYTYII